MANIDLRLKLEKFRLVRGNEQSRDEPYLWVFHVRIDGNTVDVFSPALSRVDLDGPRCGPDDLGPKGAEMEASDGWIEIPAAIGDYATTLRTDNLAFAPTLEPYCLLATLVVALESDSTRDADVELARQKVRFELQRRLNWNLRAVVQQVHDAIAHDGPLPSPGEIEKKLKAIDVEQIKRVVERTILGAIGDDLAGGLVGLITALFPPIGLAQAADPDDFVGWAIAGPFLMVDLVASSGSRIPLTLELGTDSSPDGHYRVTGYVERTDSTDHDALGMVFAQPPGGGSRLDLCVRDTFRKFTRSSHPHPTEPAWPDGWHRLPEGLFLSPPALAASNDGQRWHAFGRGMDNKIWRGHSHDGGLGWDMAWAPIGAGVFTSGPAAAASADGRKLHVFGRGNDMRIWHAYSPDAGASWPLAWVPIGDGVFTSAPAACASDDGQQLHVFGRGKDNRIWRAWSGNGGQSWNLAWVPIGEGVFQCGPAAAVSGDGRLLHVFGRGMDNRYWRAFSPDGGAHWTVAWQPVSDFGNFVSTPAVAMSPSGKELHLAGVGRDLHVWRGYTTHISQGFELAWAQVPGTVAI